MNNKSLSILFSMLAGIIVAVATRLNASLGLHVGNMKSSFMNHLVGALFAGLLLLVGFKTGSLFLPDFPFLYCLGGCFGVLMVAMCNFAIPRIGMMVGHL